MLSWSRTQAARSPAESGGMDWSETNPSVTATAPPVAASLTTHITRSSHPQPSSVTKGWLSESGRVLKSGKDATPSQNRAAAFFSTVAQWSRNVAYLVYSVLMLMWEVMAGVAGVPITAPEHEALERQLSKAASYSTWRVVGRMLDDLDGFAEWRTEEASVFFHFEGVMRCMHELAELKREGDTQALLQALLSHVQRSLYGVNNSQLYCYRTGTKNIIHSYTSLVCYLVRDLADTSSCLSHDVLADSVGGEVQQRGQPVWNFTAVTPQHRYDALAQMRVVYGCTALLLNGGTVVAPLHFGVAKALYEAGLLPQVIYGYRSGALVAALLCCNEDLSLLLGEHRLDFQALAGRDGKAAPMRRWHRLWREGHLMDADLLLRFMKDNVGEVTFMEAYRRTGRILNLQYTSFYRDESTGKTQRCSCLLNYLTAPNALVYSAAVSSLASVPMAFPHVPLLARNHDGTVVVYDPTVLMRGYPQRLSDDEGSAQETSLHRLRELFHVQYFIVSECSTLLKPSFLRRQPHRKTYGSALLGWLHFGVTEVVRLLWWLLCLTPLEPYLATVLDNDLTECDITGDAMVLIPQVKWGDLYALWCSLSRADMRRCVLKSERQVWPRLEEIRMSQAVEQAINEALLALKENHAFDVKA